jgi:hypothetical protein
VRRESERGTAPAKLTDRQTSYDFVVVFDSHRQNDEIPEWKVLAGRETR